MAIALEGLLAQLEAVNWSRENPDWQGRVIFDGHISLSQASLAYMSAYLKRFLQIPLTPAEEKLEQARHLAGWR